MSVFTDLIVRLEEARDVCEQLDFGRGRYGGDRRTSTYDEAIATAAEQAELELAMLIPLLYRRGAEIAEAPTEGVS